MLQSSSNTLLYNFTQWKEDKKHERAKVSHCLVRDSGLAYIGVITFKIMIIRVDSFKHHGIQRIHCWLLIFVMFKRCHKRKQDEK